MQREELGKSEKKDKERKANVREKC